MGVWITGDCHREVKRFNTKNFPEQLEFLEDHKDANIVIVAGDFGLVWKWDGEDAEERYWLDWLENKPFTTVFVDGNHECFPRLNALPVTEWHGGKIHEIRSNVFHLMRGEIYTIEGKTFFAFGGAASHDMADGILDAEDPYWREKAKELRDDDRFMYRIKGRDWWLEEMPNAAEMAAALLNLKKHNNCVDYIVTHCPPASIIAHSGRIGYKQDTLTAFLEGLMQRIEYKQWYSGHLHVNMQFENKNIVLYEDIVRIL